MGSTAAQKAGPLFARKVRLMPSAWRGVFIRLDERGFEPRGVEHKTVIVFISKLDFESRMQSPAANCWLEYRHKKPNYSCCYINQRS